MILTTKEKEVFEKANQQFLSFVFAMQEGLNVALDGVDKQHEENIIKVRDELADIRRTIERIKVENTRFYWVLEDDEDKREEIKTPFQFGIYLAEQISSLKEFKWKIDRTSMHIEVDGLIRAYEAILKGEKKTTFFS